MLLMNCMDSKEDFTKVLSLLNKTSRSNEFSPIELFYFLRPCSFLPDIIQEIEEGKQNRDKRPVTMQAYIRKTPDREFTHGDYVMYK